MGSIRMWRRKWFPWQQQETGEERPGEEGEGEEGGQGGRDSGEEEAADQRVKRTGWTERGWDGSGIWGRRLTVTAKCGGRARMDDSDPILSPARSQRGQSIRGW